MDCYLDLHLQPYDVIGMNDSEVEELLGEYKLSEDPNLGDEDGINIYRDYMIRQDWFWGMQVYSKKAIVSRLQSPFSTFSITETTRNNKSVFNSRILIKYE